MINVSRTRAWLAAIKGDTVAVPREQMDELLCEVELGQHARRSLISIRSVVVIAATTSGAPA